MKHFSLIFLFTITAICNISAMNYRYELPDAQTIIKRLWDGGFHHFAKQSNIGLLLDSQYFTPLMLSIKVDSFLANYAKNGPYEKKCDETKKQSYFTTTSYHEAPKKSVLMEMLLKNHPRAITALKCNYDGHFLGL